MKGYITICNSSDGAIRIYIEDDASGIQFAVAKMSPEEFGNAVTGLGSMPCQLEVRGLEHVGRKRVVEHRQIHCPLDAYDLEELEEWLKSNAQEPGWIVSAYLGSKGSVQRVDGGCLLRYAVVKYV